MALAAASLLAVMVRSMLTFRDNVAMLRASRVEASTDALTGLGNRRALARELERELPRASQKDPLVLVLFDLDGFKLYNDTFGHPAGDALLVRLGAGLASFVEGRGTAYRMGGDEFCALLRPGTRRRRRSSPARPRRSPSTATASRSAAPTARSTCRPRPRTSADALRIADQRMYAQKNAGRTSATRQSKDVLLRALAERTPDVGHDTVAGIADLAEATARELGLTAEEVEQVRHATELRDVGKVAMPDAILAKPGPLDDDEWAFIHRHTIIGERIIAAAPALNRVASARACEPRALGRRGLPRRARGRPDPARRPDRRRRRRLRGDDRRAPVRGAPLRRGCARRARGLRGHAVRPQVVSAFARALRDRAASPPRPERDSAGFARRTRARRRLSATRNPSFA